jgi:RNA polymerase sigma-70 factor (ECF subfamily)
MIERKGITGSRLSNTEKIWEGHIERIGKHRDRAAFGELFNHFSPQLKSFLMNAGTTAEQAEELVQETMIKVWRKAPTYVASKAAANTWIYTIARNTRIDWLRKQGRQNPNQISAEDLYDEREEQTPYSSLVQIRARTQVSDLMKQLPAEQVAVLQHMYFQGKSGQEVAEELGLPLGTVKSRIRLALARLKLVLVDSSAHGERADGAIS